MTRRAIQGLFVLFLSALCLLGCQGDPSTQAGEVLLRYSPQVGDSYVYKAELVGYATVTGEMEVLGKDDQWYQVEFSGPLFGQMHTVDMEISDRHNCTHPGYLSLNFPDDPVTVGDEWEGEIPWYFESRFVLDETPITVPSSYRLVDIHQGEKGRYAVIEQTVDADVVVDGLVLHVGQLGVRWDGEGRITEVHPGYDAEGRVAIGDVVVGINGEDARREQDRNWLAEEYIQHPKESATVSLTLLRDGREFAVDIQKSIDAVARVRVENLKGAHHIKFDFDRGILLSAEMTVSEDIQFSPPSDAGFPIVDSYGGYSKFGYLEGKTAYQESYGGSGVSWRLTLEE
jgi:hypothetical protein